MGKIKRYGSMFLITLTFIIAIFSGCSKTKETKIKESRGGVEASNKGNKKELITGQSRLEWTGKKITMTHHGTVDISSGELTEENGMLTGGNFLIDFRSIKNLDLEDPGMNAKLTAHLKSEDFFSAEKFPEGKFEITSIAPLADGSANNYLIYGDLTIKGITNEISFPANVKITGDGITATADFNIDRTLWDIRYGSGKFFDGLGNKMINDEFNIKFTISAK